MNTEPSWDLSATDLYLFNEGTHRHLGDKLGCQLIGPDRLAHFAVWAPNAARVEVIGDFNFWDGGETALEPLGSSGIHAGVVPEARQGHRYKFAITTKSGEHVERADPFALFAECPPRTASVVWPLDYTWGDGAWMERRAQRQAHHEPISIYEVHLGSWRRDPARPNEVLSYEAIAPLLIEHVLATGFTHVELLPVMEHPFYGSWGYQVTSYFAPSARHGTPQDLMGLIDALHGAGIGVILDWVPAHFPGDEFALARYDGTALFEHADPQRGRHPDWDTLVFNYGRHEVRSFLTSSAEHWIDRYHADGLRFDAVASMLYLDYSRQPGEWEPNRYGGREDLDAVQFLQELATGIYAEHPDIDLIAEESTAWPGVSRAVHEGGLGFGFKWDMGWMHDTLEYFSHDPVHRTYHQYDLTKRGLWAFTENYVLALSHDEVTHGKASLLSKMPGDDWQKFANLRLLFGYQFTQPGKKLVFMGSEFGQWHEWNHEGSLDWHLLEYPRHAEVLAWLRDLNSTYRNESALHDLDCDSGGYEFIDFDPAVSVVGYLRRSRGGDLVAAFFNFTPVPRQNRSVVVPEAGYWRELLNSDSVIYGGSGIGNLGGSMAHDRGDGSAELNVTLPPLSCVVFRFERS